MHPYTPCVLVLVTPSHPCTLCTPGPHTSCIHCTLTPLTLLVPIASSHPLSTGALPPLALLTSLHSSYSLHNSHSLHPCALAPLCPHTTCSLAFLVTLYPFHPCVQFTYTPCTLICMGRRAARVAEKCVMAVQGCKGRVKEVFVSSPPTSHNKFTQHWIAWGVWGCKGTSGARAQGCVPYSVILFSQSGTL